MVDVKTARENLNLTQKELGKQIGVTEQFIFYIERGDRRPGVEVAKKLGALLGFDWTLFYPDESNGQEQDTA